MIPTEAVDRNYIISSQELKAALNIKGDIKDIILWRGRSPRMIQDGVSADEEDWLIITREGETSLDTSNKG